jgi:Polyketide cyclase / dehydrase and lipid transport
MKVSAPVRVTHTCTQHIGAPPSVVFPLLCPVRETEWIPGWAPRLVITTSGTAEPGAVFVTEVEGREATWVITEHDAAAGRVGMLEVVPGLVTIQLAIAVRDAGEGRSECDVTYSYTALSPEGKAFVETRTAAWYRQFMTRWEEFLNAYIASDAVSLHDEG